MNRHDVQLLQQIKGYPAVTITLPTHSTAPENRQDPIRLGNLVKEATERLRREFGKRDITSLLTGLDQLVQSIDFRHSSNGLALFINPDFARAFSLPFTLNERVVVGETFYTRDLVFAMNRTPRYWTLALSEQPTRLFEGVRDHLTEIKDEGFPSTYEGPGAEIPMPGGRGVNKSAYRDEMHREFFRSVDSLLKTFMVDDPLPIAVAGVERHLSFFDEVSDYRNAVLTKLEGNHDHTSAHDLATLVWPLVKEKLAEERKKVHGELEKAVGEKKYASSIIEVWRLAHEGRGRLLLVEEDYHVPGRVDNTGMKLTVVDDPTPPDVMHDAVDNVIEEVLRKQGQVVFVEKGSLAEHDRIALILRY
ncbi:MAG: hypothetical protein KFH87_03160 [Bacteroidetes bacterium]|nr:hypothetical protein [Bacteroidota bacterium]